MHYQTNKYKPEIDGLRAFAVLSVVFFHAYPKFVPGGFIGVDVFFVISGFLICSHIFEQINANTFSLLDFYERRIRRLFPALIIMFIVLLLIGQYFFFAEELSLLGWHSAGGALFFQNFLLVTESNYFDDAAEEKLLLHLWSLAVEEQFYIFWPIFLLLFSKFRANLLFVTLVVGIASFSANLYFIESHPTETFFLPFTRIWELLAGSILAWVYLIRRHNQPNELSAVKTKLARHEHKYSQPLQNSNIRTEVNPFIGCLVLCYCIFYVTEEVPFPSWWALFPVVGALLIISAGSESWINRKVFSNPVSLWFGVISYPLYLWHWPLLTLERMFRNESTASYTIELVIILSVVFAWLTYKYIEKPIRSGLLRTGGAPLLLLLMASIAATGWWIHAKQELSVTGTHQNSAWFASLQATHHPCRNRAILASSPDWRGVKRCWQSKPGDPDVILLGDSHAEHLYFGFAKSLPNKNVAFYIQGGRPSLNDASFSVIFSELLRIEGSGKKIIVTTHFVQDVAKYGLFAELKEVVKELENAGFDVALVGDVPKFEIKPALCMTRQVPLRSNQGCSISISDATNQRLVYFDELEKISFEMNVPTAYADDVLCDWRRCSINLGNRILYRDNHHLNEDGSELVGAALVSSLRSSGFFP